jgi:oligosaccharyltransferase complex subunit alpha (ribophorin I)
MLKFFGLLICFAAVINGDSNADLVNTNIERTIELVTNQAHITTVITVENTAKTGSLKSYTYVLEPSLFKHLSFIGAQLSAEKANEDPEKRKLSVVPASITAKGCFYTINFKTELAAGKTLKFEVEVVLFDSLRPYPTEITQADKQYVLFKDNHYYYSIYQTIAQTTVVNLSSEKTESYSQLKPTSKSQSSITYGPYENVKPYEQSEMSIHFENNNPFLVVNNLVRTIEVSHWGNIAVEETIDISHSGAKLKGPFSRFDYMRKQGGSSSVNAIKTLLPSSAADVYYRDEIGNISTSNLRLPGKKSRDTDPIELQLRPRFPLFGGWKTHYLIGYNVPVYQYLFNKGQDYVLNMRLIDHIYDDQFVESATIRIILPEYCTDLKFTAPYNVDRQPNELHYTYLDTVGRPVVVVNLKNSAENHIKDFQLSYKFQKVMILKEPLLVIAFFFVLFMIVIVFVRIDFSIKPQASEHAKKE